MVEPSAAEKLHTHLVEVIHRNGSRRDELRIAEAKHDNPEESRRFAADLILKEENGFELWLGSLEDALHLQSIRSHSLNGILNCALEDCINECACFREPIGRTRGRTHARGTSLMNHEAEPNSETKILDIDNARATVVFDGEWYSSALGDDIDYLGLPALDDYDYPMDQHFPEIIPFLEQCRAEHRKVLIHCVMGINRSATACVAFLCRSLGMSLEGAIDLTSKSRGYILSNASFLEQLVSNFGGARTVPAQSPGDSPEENSGNHFQ